jgi:hypothetical protein
MSGNPMSAFDPRRTLACRAINHGVSGLTPRERSHVRGLAAGTYWVAPSRGCPNDAIQDQLPMDQILPVGGLSDMDGPMRFSEAEGNRNIQFVFLLSPPAPLFL